MTTDTEHRTDKLGLFVLAGMVISVLASIVIGILWIKEVPDKADVLLSAIATGLILFLRDLVNAIRSSWDAVTQAKTMERLGNSQPVNDNQPSGTVDDPLHVAGTSSDQPPVQTKVAKGAG